MRKTKRYLHSHSFRAGVLAVLTFLILLCLLLKTHREPLESTGAPGESQHPLKESDRPKEDWDQSMWDLGEKILQEDPMRSEDLRGCSVLPGCPSTPPGLLGQLEVEEEMEEAEAERRVSGVRQGGFWWPVVCEARWRVAIIVPYRDRAHQIGPFLNHMHPFLQRQQLNYSIYIVEQHGTDLFNRARLLNVGFLEAKKEGPWDCYAFHDIDMLPLNDLHLYHCSPQPRHLAVAPSSHKFKSAHHMPYKQYFGGACLMTEGHLWRVNGWSNIYWGWGGEDDDMYRRMQLTDMGVWRYPAHYARYKMISHKPQKMNPNRYQILQRNTGRYPRDGLNNINYTIKSSVRKPLYTHLIANVGASDAPTERGRTLLRPPPPPPPPPPSSFN